MSAAAPPDRRSAKPAPTHDRRSWPIRRRAGGATGRRLSPATREEQQRQRRSAGQRRGLQNLLLGNFLAFRCRSGALGLKRAAAPTFPAAVAAACCSRAAVFAVPLSQNYERPMGSANVQQTPWRFPRQGVVLRISDIRRTWRHQRDLGERCLRGRRVLGRGGSALGVARFGVDASGADAAASASRPCAYGPPSAARTSNAVDPGD